jgi:cyclopropane fatty-acyl-phospholipid synthase-like methyltransferase
LTQPESPTPDYTISYGEGFTQVERLHTAEANAAYLLPLLRPGLRVLDFGCGSGDIGGFGQGHCARRAARS